MLERTYKRKRKQQKTEQTQKKKRTNKRNENMFLNKEIEKNEQHKKRLPQALAKGQWVGKTPPVVDLFIILPPHPAITY